MATVTQLDSQPVSESPLEIVERKGIGHPDTICDVLAEAVSGALCRFYLDRFGTILHHNVDKALLCGGAAQAAFGGGAILQPIEIHIAGRATRRFRDVEIPVEELATEACRQWLGEHLPQLDANRDVRLAMHIRPTSADLAELFVRGGERGNRLANDTSFGVGFAPLDALENTVLRVARVLNDPRTCRADPAIGADIKVMGARRERETTITVACAFVGRHIASLDGYLAAKRRVGELAREAAAAADTAVTGPLAVHVNAADGPTADSIYLTVTGLSAESGDDGQVGRGNRVNGLITPYRPMSLEAAAGKNPVTHVGKLYNVMAHRIAHAVVAEVPQVREAYCYLLSRIGFPVSEPQTFDVKVRVDDAHDLDLLAPRIAASARDAFSRVESLWRESVAGTLELW